MGKALADQYGIKFFETSAKNNVNIEEVFVTVAHEAFKMYKREPIPVPTQRPSTKEKKCCFS